MQVQTVKLSQLSQSTANKILKASKSRATLGQQLQMANYYAYLHSEKTAKTDIKTSAKILLGQ